MRREDEGEWVVKPYETGEIKVGDEAIPDQYKNRVKITYTDKMPLMVHKRIMMKDYVVIQIPGPIIAKKVHTSGSGRFRVSLFTERGEVEDFMMPSILPPLLVTFIDHGGYESWPWEVYEGESMFVCFENMDNLAYDVYLSAVLVHPDNRVDGG